LAEITIYLGNKNYSSWSMRGWLAVKLSGAEFDEVVIPLDQADTRETILRYSPSGLVPVIHHGERIVWDSLAIGEYLAETFPDAGLWPADAGPRAHARAIAAEMHGGFATLRNHMPMNMRGSFPNRGREPGVQTDVNRICAIWRDTRAKYGAGGDFLFGERFTLADAMYAPVVSRFRTYKVELGEAEAGYAKAVWEHPAVKEWREAAKNEPMIIDRFEH